MREALVICPNQNNRGEDMSHVVKAAMQRLVAAFGGCTVRKSLGAWDSAGKLYVEPVTELVSACEPNAQCDAILRDVARFIGREAEQLAVYVRYASGDVEILDTAQAQTAEAA